MCVCILYGPVSLSRFGDGLEYSRPEFEPGRQGIIGFGLIIGSAGLAIERIAIGNHGNPHHKVLASLQHTNPQSESLRITALGPPLGVVVYIWPLMGLGQPFVFLELRVPDRD